ncbi:hypothetical protein D9M70_532720 [compost metagenome]
MAGAQGGNAEPQVVGGGEQQVDFLGIERLGLRGHESQHACKIAVNEERHQDGRGVATLAGFFAKGGVRVIQDVTHDHRLADFERCIHRTNESHAFGAGLPGNTKREETFFKPFIGHRVIGEGGFILAICDPSQAVAAVYD